MNCGEISKWGGGGLKAKFSHFFEIEKWKKTQF